jgi:hypothetical protein
MTSTGPASVITGGGAASAGPIATESNRVMPGGGVDDAPDVDAVGAGLGSENDEGSADIAGLGDCSGLTFSMPVGDMLVETGNDEEIGVVVGIETPLRRSLCEPAPTVLFEGSSSSISMGMCS